jgi:ubiquinol oxidase
MLHFYETLGFWRRSSDVKRIHFAQELNEFRHLLIMESLGGDQAWWVRFLAQHSAIAYYVGLSLLFAASPTLSYRFSELLETHAVNTYGQFMDENEDLLKELPPTWVAVEYYMGASSDPFYAEFQLTKQEGTVSADEIEITNLYSVFENIQADEAQHVGTMESCLDIEAALRSPSTEKSVIVGMAVLAVIGLALTSGNVEDASNPGLTDTLSGIDLSADAAVTAITNVIDAAAAGVAGIVGFTQQQQPPLMDEDEEGNIVKIGTDMLESGAFAAIAGSIEKGVEVVLKLIRVFL